MVLSLWLAGVSPSHAQDADAKLNTVFKDYLED